MKKINSYMLKAFVLPLLIVGLFTTDAFCQASLAPGDDAPSIIFQKFLQPNQSAVDLKYSNKKLIILDFWSTWCKSCIKALPKLEKLQAEFKEDVKIIAVTDQAAATVKKFFTKTGLQFNHLAVLTDDSISKKYFPYQSLPHTVWISQGKVVYVTYSYNINETVIKKFLAGDHPKLALKDGKKVYNDMAPLWAKENAHFETRPLRYSYISGWLHDYGGRLLRWFADSATNSVGIRLINIPLSYLIIEAYGPTYQYANRVIVESNAAKYVVWENKYLEEDERRGKNAVCYELKIPQSEYNRISEFIASDLNRYLDFEIKIERRPTRAYVIERIDGVPIPACTNRSKGAVVSGGEFSFCGEFKDFVRRLQKEFAFDSKPIVDNSGYSGAIQIDFAGRLNDVELAKKALLTHGFKMTEKTIELNMLVLKDRKPGNGPNEVPDLLNPIP